MNSLVCVVLDSESRASRAQGNHSTTESPSPVLVRTFNGGSTAIPVSLLLSTNVFTIMLLEVKKI